MARSIRKVKTEVAADAGAEPTLDADVASTPEPGTIEDPEAYERALAEKVIAEVSGDPQNLLAWGQAGRYHAALERILSYARGEARAKVYPYDKPAREVVEEFERLAREGLGYEVEDAATDHLSR